MMIPLTDFNAGYDQPSDPPPSFDQTSFDGSPANGRSTTTQATRPARDRDRSLTHFEVTAAIDHFANCYESPEFKFSLCSHTAVCIEITRSLAKTK